MSRQRKKMDPKDLHGISIYHEEKRTVYAPFYTNKGYIITENNINHYINYIQGYLIALLIFVLTYIVYQKVWIPLLLAIIFMVSTIVVFYRNFLSRANVIENYKKPQRDNFAIRQAKSLDEKNIWTVIICSPLLAIAIMFNSYLNKYEGGMYYLMLFISVVALAYGILHIYILIYKRKNKV